jgi:hypothetical protein
MSLILFTGLLFIAGIINELGYSHQEGFAFHFLVLHYWPECFRLFRILTGPGVSARHAPLKSIRYPDPGALDIESFPIPGMKFKYMG